MKNNQMLLIISSLIINLSVSSTWANLTNENLEFRTELVQYPILNLGNNSNTNFSNIGDADCIQTNCMASEYTLIDLHNFQSNHLNYTGIMISDYDCATSEWVFVENANTMLLKHTTFVDSGWGSVDSNINCLFNLNPGIIILGIISIGFAVWAKRRITV